MLRTRHASLPTAAALLLVALTSAACSSEPGPGDGGAMRDAGAPGDAAGPDAATDPSRVAFDDPGASVLTVFAHPDDEVGSAPILGKLCNDLDAECTMVVLTRGEAGSCHSPDGCDADLGAQRTEEMAAAAELYGARLHHWDWGDGRAAEWADLHGGRQELIDRIAAVVEQADPDIVFLHDPRHGTYCHPDHRAASAVALLAMDQLGVAPRVYFREGLGTPQVRTSWDAESMPIEDDALVYFDATEHLPSIDGEAWDYLARNMWKHRSQSEAGSLAELRESADVPERYKRGYMLGLDDAMEDDERYEVCR